MFDRSIAFALCAMIACKPIPSEERGKKIVHLGLRGQVGTLDPIKASTQFAALGQSPVYETLLEYDFEARPLQLAPLLVEAMPEISADLLRYTFTLRDDVYFHDDPCFADGRGRKVTSDDVFYSLRRHADRRQGSQGWWIFQGRIVGFDAYRSREPFEPDAAVAGLVRIDDRRFAIELTAPYPQLLHVMAMAYTAIVPKEAVEKYGDAFARHPVGTGPFVLERWTSPLELRFARNERYRSVKHPITGGRVPAADGIWLAVFEEDQPMWLKWRVGDLDLIQVPPEFLPSVVDEKGALRAAMKEDGVQLYRYAVVDLVYRGFNMEDPIVGGEKGKKLRLALGAALDTDELIETFYSGAAIPYDGPIPPGLEGHAEGRSSLRGPNLELARRLIAEAGYPGGEGLGPLRMAIIRSGNTAEQAELLRRQWKQIGVTLEVEPMSLPEFDAALKKKKAQVFNAAWVSDYPDAENNLALFYGPNGPPGANHFNYRREDYDRLYEAARVMPPSPERTMLYVQMRDRIIEDAPLIGSLARTRYYVWNPRLHHVRPDETGWLWIKHLEPDAR